MARNVLGDELETCGCDPMTGFYRTGCCDTGAEDMGVHTVCAVVTAEFLRFSAEAGNDLSTPRPEFGFAGLRPGDRWCLCASRWAEATPRASRHRWCSRPPTRARWSGSTSRTWKRTPHPERKSGCSWVADARWAITVTSRESANRRRGGHGHPTEVTRRRSGDRADDSGVPMWRSTTARASAS